MFPSYRNQSIDVHSKSIIWFLYEGNTGIYWVKHQPHKMVKHIQTIRRQQPTNFLSVFDYFVGMVPKLLNLVFFIVVSLCV